ncbi:DUF2846 domain-containing protein [Marinagarivorans algicola]|uniref:DUF2846 domain-containing protein n=1 Tax=Marinagarivorans algicola TaxID=1513270 RepID=UPI0037352CBD
MKYLYILFLSAALMACSTTPKNAKTFTDTAIGVPDDKQAVIILYRKTVPPLAYSVKALVDGNLVAKLPNKSFTWLYVEPGEHEVKFSWPVFALMLGQKKKVTVEAGRYYFFELGGDMNYAIGTAYITHSVSAGTYQVKADDVRACCKYIRAN